jgi:hypothetical protein
MSYARLGLLSTALAFTLGATPVLAQTFNGYDNKDAAVTQGYAPFEHPGYNNNNGWNNGPPVIGPLFGAATAPFAVATGGWGQPTSGCFLDRDFNGRYTAMCGL